MVNTKTSSIGNIYFNTPPSAHPPCIPPPPPPPPPRRRPTTPTTPLDITHSLLTQKITRETHRHLTELSIKTIKYL